MRILKAIRNLFVSKNEKQNRINAEKVREEMQARENQKRKHNAERERILEEKRKELIEYMKPKPSNNQRKRCADGIHVYGTTDQGQYAKKKCIFCSKQYVTPKTSARQF